MWGWRRQAKRATQTVGAVVADVLGGRRALTMPERIAREERRKRAWMARQPSVDEVQRREAAAAAVRAEAAADQLARELVWGRAVFPGEATSPVIALEAWGSRTVTEAGAPASLPRVPYDEYADDLSSGNPNRMLKWISDEERLGPRLGW